MGVKINLRIITKNHAADPGIGFLAKSISKSNGCALATPTGWELKSISVLLTYMGFPSAACWTLDAKMMPVRSLSISKSVSIFSGIPASKAYVKPNF